MCIFAIPLSFVPPADPSAVMDRLLELHTPSNPYPFVEASTLSLFPLNNYLCLSFIKIFFFF